MSRPSPGVHRSERMRYILFVVVSAFILADQHLRLRPRRPAWMIKVLGRAARLQPPATAGPGPWAGRGQRGCAGGGARAGEQAGSVAGRKAGHGGGGQARGEAGGVAAGGRGVPGGPGSAGPPPQPPRPAARAPPLSPVYARKPRKCECANVRNWFRTAKPTPFRTPVWKLEEEVWTLRLRP